MPDDPDVPLPVEVIPSVEGGVSAIASGHAPFLYFEDAVAFGYLNGIIRVTLTASRDFPVLGASSPGSDNVVVAHLRMNSPAALSLKTAIEKALLLAAPVAGASGDAPKPN